MKSKTKGLAIFTLFMAFLISVLGFGFTGAMNENAVADETIVEKIYEIASVEDLNQFATSVNQGNDYAGETVTLTTDINLTGNWTSIGNGTRSGTGYGGNAFKGTFEGGEKTISGLDASLFGVIDGGTVQNLNLNVNVNATGDAVGAAAAYIFNGGKVSNVNVTGSITGVEGVGGVVGRIIINGTVDNCTNDATVTATGSDAAGGIVGKAYYTKADVKAIISNCVNNGKISSAYAAGGIVGFSAAYVENCTNNGLVTASLEAGGIVGEQTNYGVVNGNTNTADVSGSKAGGIVGWVRYQNNSAAYPVSAVISVNGNANSGNIKGDEQAQSSAGGIIGLVYNQINVIDNTNTAEYIIAKTFAAGIVGGIQVETNNIQLANDNCKIGGNKSTTVNIKADCVNTLVYNNTGADSGVLEVPEGTTNVVPEQEELAQVAKVETVYASLAEALAAAPTGSIVTLLDNVTIGENGEESGNVDAVAKVETIYASLAEAVAAAPTGSTVTLLCDDLGSGLVINKDLTVDFDGNTYTVNKAVGSTGTETLAIQVLAGSNAAPYDVTLKNGTVNVVETPVAGSKEIKVVIMNYSNLTLEDITVDGTGNSEMIYAFATNNGKAELKGETSLMVNDGAYAVVDVDGSQDYYGNAEIVINTTGTITGNVEIYGNEANVRIDAGAFDGEFNVASEATGAVTVTGGSFTDENVKTYVAAGETVTVNEKEAIGVGAVIDGVSYWTLADAIKAANGKGGAVTVEIYGKVEYTSETANLLDSLDVINFVGKTFDAEISITRNGSNGYISGSGTENAPTVNFTDLILSKPAGAYAGDAGFMNVYFTVYRVAAVNYNNCVFPDGACAQGCPVTYTDCEFANKTSGEYSLWVYANTTVTVTDSKFTGVRGVKMYSESAATGGVIDNELILNNTEFTESVTQKPAIVLTYGESVTLENNTYPETGVFELDADGKPNGTTVTADITNIPCYVEINDEMVSRGVLVDGKIYKSLTDAVDAKAVKNDSVVTLMYAAEDVAIPGGATVITNDYDFTRVKTGTLTDGYVLADRVNGEFTANATESVVIEVYDADGNVMGKATLKDYNDKINGEISTTTWRIYTDEDKGSSDYWDTEWYVGRVWNVEPAMVALFVDGVEVAKKGVAMKESGDGLNPIKWYNVAGVEGAPVMITDESGNLVKKCDDLQEAIGVATNGQIITLYEDQTITEKIPIDKSLVLDLNKMTITVSGVEKSRAIVLEEGCETFVINGNGGKIVSADALSLGIVDVNTAADVTVNGGTYDYDTNNGGLFKFRNFKSSITLNDVTVMTNGQISGPNYAENVLTVNGGKFYAENGYNARNVFAFYIYAAKATFTNVTIENEYIGGIEVCYSEVTLTNCNITVNGTNSAPYLSGAVAVSGGGKLTVDGGTYKTAPLAASDANGQGTTHGSWTVLIMSSGGTIIINDGTFENGNFGDTAASNPRSVISVGANSYYGDNIAADLQINGGKFISIGGVIDCETIWNEEGKTASMAINITDGDFTECAKAIAGCDPISTGNPVQVAISGGSFSADSAIDDSYEVDGFYSVKTADDTIEVIPSPLTGKGTQNDPYVISCVDGLNLFARRVNNGRYANAYAVLGANIDLDGAAVIIGTKTNPFKGEFDGKNYTISNLVIEQAYADYVGLFGYAEEVTLKNVKVENVSVAGRAYVGGIAGCVKTGTIENCHVSGIISVKGNYKVGGIVGDSYAKILNCSVIGSTATTFSLTATENIIEATYLETDYEGDNVGGIVGFRGEGDMLLSDCTVENVTVSGTRKIGGIAGSAFQDNNIVNCSVNNVIVRTTATEEYANSNASSMAMGGIVGLTSGTYTGGSLTGASVESLSFENVNDVTVSAGALTGGHRGTSAPEQSDGMTVSDNTVDVNTVVGATNTYLAPEFAVSTDGYWVINGIKTEYLAVVTVDRIENIGTENNETTYRVYLTDGSHYDFTVTNGVDGEDGKDGVDGEDGKDGADGVDGKTPQLRINSDTNEWEVSYDDGKTWTSLGIKATGNDGADGAAGVPGAPGADGADGEDGADGKDGVDGKTPQIRINGETNEWEVSYDDGKTWTSLGVKATGNDGADGEDGVDGKDGKDGSNGAGETATASIILSNGVLLMCVLMVVWVSVKLRKKN